MAKRKTPVEEIDETLVETTETVEAPVENEQVLDTAESVTVPESTEKPKVEAKEKSKRTPKQDIPDDVLAILKTFSNYPELLVTSQGCVYTPGCKLEAAKAAILYKNPFYNT